MISVQVYSSEVVYYFSKKRKMVFKLVRTDAEEPNKIQLPLGTHLIGRGKFLECEDKRISRNHGHLIITEDSVTIEALHQNPCFFTKRGSDEKQVLKKSFKETLDNGDRFGLLPGSYWYEVLLCTADTDSQATDVSNTQELGNADDISTNHENGQQNNRVVQDKNRESSPFNDGAAKTINPENGPHNDRTAEEKTNNENSQNDKTISEEDGNATSDGGHGDNDESLVNFDLNETVENAGRSESPSLLDQQNEPLNDSANQSMDPAPPTPDPSATDNPDPPEPTPENPPPAESQQPESKSPKRSHSPDEDMVKRIKTEPVDVKQEVKQDPDDGRAGPSSSPADQAGASHDAGSSKAAPPRERCIYGASCYRRNPAHKAQFAHPTDTDWGTGDKAPCPYGAACRKRDPRHWQVHEHPPQARPPAPVPQQKPRAKPKRRQHSSSDSDSSPGGPVLATKRARKPLPRADGDSEGDEDPYASDGSDDWVPPSD